MEERSSVKQPPATGSRTLPGWRDLLCSRIAQLDVVAAGARDGRFTGIFSEVAVGSVRVDRVTVRADPYLVKRVLPPRTETGAPVIVAVLVHGHCVVYQDGREAMVRPGDLVLYDAARSYRVVYPGGDHTHVALRLPPEVLQRSLRSLADVTAVTVSGTRGMGAAVAPLLVGLHSALPTLDATAASRLLGRAIDLMADAFFLDGRGHGTEREARLLHAQRYIQASLDDDDLNPAAVAEAVNVSISHLHRLFRGTGTTVRQSILRARLEQCAAELREAAHRDETVTEIAHRNGFKDTAHFTRAFLQRYGETPSRWRRTAGGPE